MIYFVKCEEKPKCEIAFTCLNYDVIRSYVKQFLYSIQAKLYLKVYHSENELKT